jgi:dihydrofolate reductase
VRALLDHDLVDELRLMVFPIVLGTGDRLFGELSDKKPMRLVDTRAVGDGVAILTYEPVRQAARSSEDVYEDAKKAAFSRVGISEGA